MLPEKTKVVVDTDKPLSSEFIFELWTLGDQPD